ncbi:hypothetical protein [Allosphingosinicella indica]|uniref:Uncharacterized protein n=1 Tax=Allosphingosinicella indica TaxID=941907 RepID=A0A1X7G076_9SPHN|nr:hypothetical protein [Allosphingosinicella indica]SMF61752.1 hypothetical protein SAMN06295910_0745 [Allosphingosinicella indica]
MRLMLVPVAAAIALTGCDSGAQQQQPAPARPIKVTGDKDYQAELKSLTETNRNLTLLRAVQDTGNACRRVEGSVETGTYKNFDAWTVRCTGTGDWLVFLAATGDVQVRACKETAELKLPACASDRIPEKAE